MKTGFALNVKEYFWTSLKRFTNTFSNLQVTNLGNGYVKCFWEISSIDNMRIELSKSCFYAIRLFDITNNRNKKNSTCIMKEIQVKNFNLLFHFLFLLIKVCIISSLVTARKMVIGGSLHFKS